MVVMTQVKIEERTVNLQSKSKDSQLTINKRI